MPKAPVKQLIEANLTQTHQLKFDINGQADGVPATFFVAKLAKDVEALGSWGGILTDTDPPGSYDCVWLSHTTSFPPTFKLKVRKNNIVSVLLTLNL